MTEATKVARGARRDMTMYDPASLTIVGLDVPGAQDHPCWDPERLERPLNPSAVIDVLYHGITLPVVCRRNGELVEIVDGKTRVRWARTANAAYGSSVMVPVIFVRGTDDEIRRLVVTLNELRESDPPTVKAAKAERMRAAGMDEAVIAASFGIKVPMLRRWRNLGELAEPVARMVDAGELSVSDATLKVAKIPREKQEAAAATLKKGVKPRVKRKPNRSLIRKVAGRFKTRLVREALLWSIGESQAKHGALKAAIKTARGKS